MIWKTYNGISWSSKDVVECHLQSRRNKSQYKFKKINTQTHTHTHTCVYVLSVNITILSVRRKRSDEGKRWRTGVLRSTRCLIQLILSSASLILTGTKVWTFTISSAVSSSSRMTKAWDTYTQFQSMTLYMTQSKQIHPKYESWKNYIGVLHSAK